MKVKSMKGFTLAELLIVMAIVVILAAVAIPTFGRQLETARETGDMEIIRSLYNEALAVASLDASDGSLNGRIGSSETTGGTALPVVATGAATVSNSDAIAFVTETTASATTGQYLVTLAKMDPAIKFSQAKPSEGAGEWKYVSQTLFASTVPPVNNTTTYVVFKFQISDDGNVRLVADSGTGASLVSAITADGAGS